MIGAGNIDVGRKNCYVASGITPSPQRFFHRIGKPDFRSGLAPIHATETKTTFFLSSSKGYGTSP